MGFFDFGTIFFLIAAVVIFFQLRNVLGRRTGSERPPFDPYTAARNREKEPVAPSAENVVSLPKKRAAGANGSAKTCSSSPGQAKRSIACSLSLDSGDLGGEVVELFAGTLTG